jgi:hypothetical protein
MAYSVDPKTKQIFVHYNLWEDHAMWRTLTRLEEPEFRKMAIDFTGDYIRYGRAMMKVIDQWPNTCMNSLSNPSINRRAFIGHAACQLEINCPEYIVRQAWWMLNENQRILADKEADKAIQEWEQRRKSGNILIYGSRGVTRMGYQMKLRLNWNT